MTCYNLQFQCIELYTVENGEQRVGFYSLEMAVDLELDPKQYHVIAFEDASDCKNLCYIIQAHMELLGNGNAFVVARPPKVITEVSNLVYNAVLGFMIFPWRVYICLNIMCRVIQPSYWDYSP